MAVAGALGFGIGFGGDMLSQTWIEEKDFGSIDYGRAALAGAINTTGSMVGFGVTMGLSGGIGSQAGKTIFKVMVDLLKDPVGAWLGQATFGLVMASFSILPGIISATKENSQRRLIPYE